MANVVAGSSSMFSNCTSLVTAPELPATTLANGCYNTMFSGCTKLNYIKALFTTTPSATYTQNWVSGVSSTGKFVKSKYATWNVTGDDGIPTSWTVEILRNPSDYLTIEALENNLTVSFSGNTIQYSNNDCKTWIELPTNTATPLINKGQKLYFRGNLTPTLAVGIGTFTISKKCNLSGNCNSMLFGEYADSNSDLPDKDYTFNKLFYNCSTIIDASQLILPATTLEPSCYRYMFTYCTSLTQAPALPATTLADNCYDLMFYGCTSLVTAPALPATTLVEYCYMSMFANCTSLVTAPELPATTLAEGCYRYMFSNCTSLVTAPVLPATTLVDGCYTYMFYGCSKLNYIKALFTSTPSATYTQNWVDSVSSTGTFVKNANATWNVTGVNGIPAGWTVQTA